MKFIWKEKNKLMELYQDVKKRITNLGKRVRKKERKKLTKGQEKELQQLEFELEELL